MPFRCLFVDVAQTLVHKPAVIDAIRATLAAHGHAVDPSLLGRNHRLLSEAIAFPDRTTPEFYSRFNAELLYSLGIIPNDRLLGEIFEACRSLPWAVFPDTAALQRVTLPIGVISNWDETLPDKLARWFSVDFFRVVVSASVGAAKPSPLIYEAALRGLDVAPNEIAYVGDSLKLDIEPALEAGIAPVLIDRDGLYPAFAGHRLRSLDELPAFLNG